MANDGMLRADFEEYRRILTSIARSHSRTDANVAARLDWMEARLAAIEAHLGIETPAVPPEAFAPSDEDLAAALMRMNREGVTAPAAEARHVSVEGEEPPAEIAEMAAELAAEAEVARGAEVTRLGEQK